MEEFFIERPEERAVPPLPEIPESPPGLAEITIRTMASDIESMMASGGGVPEIHKLQVPLKYVSPKAEEPALKKPTFIPGHAAAPKAEEPKAEVETRPGPHTLRSIIIAVLAAGALFAIGYFLLPVIFPPPPEVVELPPKEVSLPEAPPAPAPPPRKPLVHSSFFRLPADEIFTLALEPAAGVSLLQAYNRKLLEFFRGARATSTFFEAAVQNESAEQIPLTDFFGIINISQPEAAFWSENFNPDFTAYVYKDKNGFWPGYVLELKKDTAPLLLQDQLIKLESDVAGLRNFFVGPLGTQVGQFKDSQLVGQPVRALQFSTAGATFAYGWFFNKYLIFSTSLEGLRKALEKF